MICKTDVIKLEFKIKATFRRCFCVSELRNWMRITCLRIFMWAAATRTLLHIYRQARPALPRSQFNFDLIIVLFSVKSFFTTWPLCTEIGCFLSSCLPLNQRTPYAGGAIRTNLSLKIVKHLSALKCSPSVK